MRATLRLSSPAWLAAPHTTSVIAPGRHRGCGRTGPPARWRRDRRDGRRSAHRGDARSACGSSRRRRRRAPFWPWASPRCVHLTHTRALCVSCDARGHADDASRGDRRARRRRRHPRPRRVHRSHSGRRRSRDHPPRPARSHRRADDPGHRLRPDDRRRVRAQVDLFVGRQSRRRVIAPVPRRGQNGWPRPLEIEEHSHAGMANRYAAGAAGLPFAVLRGYRGTDLVGHTATLSTITCPFTGEQLTAVPAINPDVTVIHAQQADTTGNVMMWGITGVQKEAMLGREASARHGRGDRRRPATARRRRHPVVGRFPRRRCARRRSPSYAQGYRLATTTTTENGTPSRPTASDSREWLQRPCCAHRRPRYEPAPRIWGSFVSDADTNVPQKGRWHGSSPDGGGAVSPSFSADDAMTIAAARCLADGAVCFVGIGLPSTAANLARRTHAPNLVLVYESGTLGSKPERSAPVDR